MLVVNLLGIHDTRDTRDTEGYCRKSVRDRGHDWRDNGALGDTGVEEVNLWRIGGAAERILGTLRVLSVNLTGRGDTSERILGILWILGVNLLGIGKPLRG